MATVTLNRADTVIAMRTAWERAHERRRGLRGGYKYLRFEFEYQLKLAYEAIRVMKARAAHKAAELERERVTAEAMKAAAERKLPWTGGGRGRWEGPQHLLDMRDVAELEVLRFEMADAFTATGNSRLFEAQAQLAAIEAQLTRRTVA